MGTIDFGSSIYVYLYIHISHNNILSLCGVVDDASLPNRINNYESVFDANGNVIHGDGDSNATDNDDDDDDDDYDDEESFDSTEQRRSDAHHRNVFSISDDHVSNMNHMTEPDDSTEANDDDMNAHGGGIFKRDVWRRIDIDRKKRQHQIIVIKYQWYRNEQLLSNDVNETMFHVFANGTLRIGYTPLANGHYRCMAIANGLGRVLSTSSHVQQASKFKLNPFLVYQNVTHVNIHYI